MASIAQKPRLRHRTGRAARASAGPCSWIALARERLESDALECLRLGGRNPQLSRGLLLVPQLARIAACDAAEDHERGALVPVHARTVAVGTPEIDLAGADAVIRIARRDAFGDGPVPCLPSRYHHLINVWGAPRRLFVRGAYVVRHGFDGLSEPMARSQIGLVGP